MKVFCQSLVATLVCGGVILGMTRASAQAIAPASDGTGTLVNQQGNQFNIGGGTLSRDGANLFHSFSQFGLDSGQVANFLSRPEIINILGRVIGSNPSLIDGLIQVSGGNSNLFLLNPNGIIFGTNARLNITGDFTATTATGISFGNNQFQVVGSNPYADLVGIPSNFIFQSLRPGAIINAGQLEVGGQNLTLLGGNVVNTGTLTATGGTIAIASVPGSSLVRLSQPGHLLSLEIQPANPIVPNAPTLAELLTGAGTIPGFTVDSNNVAIDNIVIPSDRPITIASGSLDVSGQMGGTIQVLGDRVGLINANINANGLNNGGTILIGGDYQGRGIVPNATQTYVSPNSTLTANSLIKGNGGRVIIWANDTTQFFGNINARGGVNSGNGGFVEVSGKEYLTFDGLVDVGASQGIAGNLLLDPRNILISTGASSPGVNAALPDIFQSDFANTDITIQAATLQSQTGNVVLEATDNIQVANGVSLNFVAGGGSIQFRADTDSNGVGSFLMNGGNIRTNGRDLTITAANIITGNINTSVSAVNAIAGVVDLQASGSIATGNINTSALSSGGAAVVSATGGAIALRAGSTISTGNINASATATQVSAGSTIATGGTVDFRAGSGITTGTLSTVAISTGGSPTALGTSGDVTLRSLNVGGNIRFINIDTHSEVSAIGAITATSTSGNVVIRANGLVQGTDPDTSIFTEPSVVASPAPGIVNPGTVTIQHDGGPNNVPFVVGSPSNNGTAGAISAGGSGLILSGSYPVLASGGLASGTPSGIQISSINSAPNLTATVTTPTLSLGQSATFNYADLAATVFDSNLDNTTIQISAIAPSGVLTRNGIILTPGTIINPGDILVYTPPSGTIGNNNAFTIIANDHRITPATPLSFSDPQSIFINVINGDNGTPGCVSNCNPSNPIPDNDGFYLPFESPTTPLSITTIPPLELDTTLNEIDRRFTRSFEQYLGLTNPVPITTIAAVREILNGIERATGIKPAIIYVSFVPKVPTIGGNKAVIKDYPPQPDDQLELLLVTAKDAPVLKRIPGTTRAQVLRMADEFRGSVTNFRSSQGYVPSSTQLYHWLVAPIEGDLQSRGIRNLSFLMDTGLRSLPVAALRDEKGFIIERYSVGLMPSLSLTDTRYKDIKNSQVLAMGASQFPDQNPLPGVQAELSEITPKLWEGKSFINSAFTLENLKSQRSPNQPFGIIHLATHGVFSAGIPSNSYIALWNTKLRLNQLSQLGWSNPPVELLVLSACQTALGNNEAELGFGGLAVQSGAKSALASLWSVSDEGTLGLMSEFYRQLKTAPIKAEALRLTQLAMLRGEIRLQSGILKTPTDAIALPPELAQTDQTFTHPYYWSAFTMIGNPW